MKKTLPLAIALCCAVILPAEKDYAEFDKKLSGEFAERFAQVLLSQ